MDLGDIVIAVDCTTNGSGQNEHPAIVTKVISATEVNCVLFVDGTSGDQVPEMGLKHFSVQPTGKRYRLKGESE
jgi:hypothetical protein